MRDWSRYARSNHPPDMGMTRLQEPTGRRWSMPIRSIAVTRKNDATTIDTTYSYSDCVVHDLDELA